MRGPSGARAISWVMPMLLVASQLVPLRFRCPYPLNPRTCNSGQTARGGPIGFARKPLLAGDLETDRESNSRDFFRLRATSIRDRFPENRPNEGPRQDGQAGLVFQTPETRRRTNGFATGLTPEARSCMEKRGKTVLERGSSKAASNSSRPREGDARLSLPTACCKQTRYACPNRYACALRASSCW